MNLLQEQSEDTFFKKRLFCDPVTRYKCRHLPYDFRCTVLVFFAGCRFRPGEVKVQRTDEMAESRGKNSADSASGREIDSTDRGG